MSLSVRRPQMALNLQRKAPCGRAWREGNSTSHGPSLQATQGRSSGSRKLGPGPLPAQASWKGKIRRKKGPRGKEVVVPRRARRWPTCPLLWNESVRGCPSAVSQRLRHACSSHTPRVFTAAKPRTLPGQACSLVSTMGICTGAHRDPPPRSPG